MSKETRYVIFELLAGSEIPSRRFAIGQARLRKGLLVGGSLLALATLVGGIVAVSAARRSARLADENLLLTRRTEVLDRRVEQAEATLVRVQGHDARIRSLTRADEGVRPFGIGPLQELELLALKEGTEGSTLPVDIGADTAPVTPRTVTLEERVDRLAEALEAEEISLQEVRGYLISRDALMDAYPTAWPADGWLTSRYGFRRSPLPGSKPFHTGIDVAANYGTAIRATADGVVVSARFREAYGWTVEIDHGFGIGTLYAHCSRVLVDEGDEVSRGEVIARLGATGRATGPHVHYEVHRDDVPVDPEPYLIEELITPVDP